MEFYDIPTEQDIENIVNALNSPSFTGSEIMARCAFHDDNTPSMRFNTSKGVFLCYSCGERGNFKKLARHLGVSVAGQDGEQPIEVTLQQVIRILDRRVEVPHQSILPEEYLLQFDNPTDYWKGRGFSDETINRFQLGFDYSADAGTIPVRNPNGELLGIIRRFLDPDEPSKYKNYSGFKRNSNLFASWLLTKDPVDTVVLTEGPLDAVAVWDAGIPALAQFGSSLSPDQVKIMVRLGASKVILMFDNDDAGYRAKKRAQGLDSDGRYSQDTDLTRRFEVYDVLYPIRAKDPGDLTREEINIMVEEARWLNAW